MTRESLHQDRKNWQIFLRTVRHFFEEQGFLHWQTPTLLPSPGIDAHIDFFSAQGVRTGRSFYLPTSPEFSLKKAIADGENKIFEIKPCFRDDDPSQTHLAEFTMIEWYKTYDDKWTLFEDFLSLVRYVQQEMNLGEGLNFDSQKTSIAQLFKEYVDFSLTPQTTKAELQEVLEEKKMDWTDADDWDDLFFRLFIEKVEPHLGLLGPQAVEYFPASQGSLSLITSEGWADRFEIYWNGIELANAYQEQNDPQLIENRYQSELAKRLSLGRSPYPMDEEFLEKIRQGFPPCAGIALGLDRLWMVLNRKEKITY